MFKLIDIGFLYIIISQKKLKMFTYLVKRLRYEQMVTNKNYSNKESRD